MQLGDYFATYFREYFSTLFACSVGNCCRYRCRTVIYINEVFDQLIGNFELTNFLVFSFRSSVQTKDNSYWRQNETSFVMTGISFFFPTCFEILGLLEKYHPRKQLRWQLGRYISENPIHISLLNERKKHTFSSIFSELCC